MSCRLPALPLGVVVDLEDDVGLGGNADADAHRAGDGARVPAVQKLNSSASKPGPDGAA